MSAYLRHHKHNRLLPNTASADRFAALAAADAHVELSAARSIYFRIPSGILFEIATDGPGFATDEDPEHLGERLALPPFLEPRRQQIEQGLKPLN